MKSHTSSKLNSLLLFSQRSCDVIANLHNVPIISSSWRYRFGDHTRIEKRIPMHLIYYVEIFFWRTQTTALPTVTLGPFIWSKPCRSSSASLQNAMSKSACAIRVAFTQWSRPCYHTLNYRMFVKTHTRQKCSLTCKVWDRVEWS